MRKLGGSGAYNFLPESFMLAMVFYMRIVQLQFDGLKNYEGPVEKIEEFIQSKRIPKKIAI